MKKEYKEKWLKALRSGEYKQTRSVLHYAEHREEGPTGKTLGGYCCLGVLCDLLAKEGIGKWDMIDIDGDKYFVDPMGTRSVTQPSSFLLETVGLSQVHREELISMNDTRKLGFTEIADWIEKYA